ncbi:MAG TPA: hypothetical protein PLF31_03060 [Candidatus Paceibacterota bacterium]|nr:hypothetical protein [Candidatus Paceibacterota bacterium]
MDNQTPTSSDVSPVTPPSVNPHITQSSEPMPRRPKFVLTIIIATVCASIAIPITGLILLFTMAFNDSGAGIGSVIKVVLAIFSVGILPYIVALLVPALFIDIKMSTPGRVGRKIIVFIALAIVTFFVAAIIVGLFMSIAKDKGNSIEEVHERFMPNFDPETDRIFTCTKDKIIAQELLANKPNFGNPKMYDYVLSEIFYTTPERGSSAAVIAYVDDSKIIFDTGWRTPSYQENARNNQIQEVEKMKECRDAEGKTVLDYFTAPDFGVSSTSVEKVNATSSPVVQ